MLAASVPLASVYTTSMGIDLVSRLPVCDTSSGDRLVTGKLFFYNSVAVVAC